ncbi:MAG TPA: 16S rRNA (adenine(1518)-N(6)/adenine(1519)-N(6))-dimethyltransferase RsmA [Actinomycetota bacterium]|nr:16S rRNA (adenine(1518)-N(6)/adenine(1519)-N(6))-dimethyltransferase RsmA [Actinomycetota bacterium]
MVARKLLSPADVRELARRYGITPSKALGQNFVIDQNTIRRIVRLAEIQPSDRVVEVGAGLGTLTLGLAEAASSVTAIELDRKLVPALEEVVQGIANVRIVVGDAMRLDYGPLLGQPPYRMVANLPYNIATPLLAGLLQERPEITDFVVMVQREVGERFVAAPGSKTYGGVSVLVAYHAEARALGRVPPSVFWPVPKVESILVRLTRRPLTGDVGGEELMRVVRAAFGQRRKTVRNTLASGLEMDPADVEAALDDAGIDPGRRAESLSLEEFAGLVRALR